VFRVSREGVTPEDQDTPLARILADASLDEVGAVLSSARPDPVAEQNRHLLPRARLAAVIAARTAQR
jgi:hypothetical protein